MRLADSDLVQFHDYSFVRHGVLHDVSGDGNCLFRALSHQFYDTTGQYLFLRNACCVYIEENANLFMPFDIDIPMYLKELKKDGVWGDGIALYAFALANICNIIIYYYPDVEFHTIEIPDSVRTINLAFVDGNHYKSIKWNDN